MSNRNGNPFAGKHILVVDDTESVAEFMDLVLTREGYIVSSVESGEAALEFVAECAPDLILLDVMMKGIDGFETCRRLKEDEVSKHIPVVFVTAKDDPEDVVKGFNLGAVDFVTKPVRKEDVRARVATHLKVQGFIQGQKDQLIQAEKLASIAELMGEFSHELETPIGIILTAQTHLEEKLREFEKLMSANRLTKSKLTKFFDLVEDSNRLTMANIKRAIERTSSFKRLSVDQCSEERRSFNMLEYLHHIELALSTRFLNNDHRIVIDCDEELMLDSFPGALSQVLINLINNSLMHGFEEMDEGRIDIRVQQTPDAIDIQYRDNGKGIEPELLPKVFNQYFTSKPQHGGSGIGLYLVKSIIEKKLRGSLDCHSELGEGITFNIQLPLEPG